MNKNSMIGLAYKSVAKYFIKFEENPEDWHLAPVRGHTHIPKLLTFIWQT
jgi:hypothetical protein